jgi:acyl-CoA thioesterase-1
MKCINPCYHIFNPSLSFLVLFSFLLSGCQQPLANLDSPGSTIVCFGDSLTAGYGADPGHDYPSLLKEKTSLPVINTGVYGNTTADALLRLDKDVLAHDPKIVIITLGGNDFLRGMTVDETVSNMTKIIDRIKEHKAMVVWAEVQTGVLGDPNLDAFKALAGREHIMLISNILNGIIDHPAYKYDQIHPNNEGYKIMADKIYQNIKGLL